MNRADRIEPTESSRANRIKRIDPTESNQTNRSSAAGGIGQRYADRDRSPSDDFSAPGAVFAGRLSRFVRSGVEVGMEEREFGIDAPQRRDLVDEAVREREDLYW